MDCLRRAKPGNAMSATSTEKIHNQKQGNIWRGQFWNRISNPYGKTGLVIPALDSYILSFSFQFLTANTWKQYSICDIKQKIHTHTHTHIYIYIYIYMYIYIYIIYTLCVCVCARVCLRVCARVLACVCVCVCEIERVSECVYLKSIY